MPEVRERLQKVWANSFVNLGGQTDPNIPFNDLFDRYQARSQGHHGPNHLADILDKLAEVTDSIKDPDSVYMAALAHDVIQRPEIRLFQNEVASGFWLYRNLIQGGIAIPRIQRPVELVYGTNHSLPPNMRDNDLLYLRDADMSILGAPPEEFDEYVERLRVAEYDFLTDEQFYNGRLAFTYRLLDRKKTPLIFYSSHFRIKYDEPTRENLVRSAQNIQEILSNLAV